MSPRLATSEEAAGILDSGGVLVLGTDTLPGLHARADDPEAVARIFALKGRPPQQALLLLASSAEQAALVSGPWDAGQRACCRACWPGPFSLILPARPVLPRIVTAGGDTVAVRVPRPDPLRDLVARVGYPVVSTSANLTGQPPATDAEAAAAIFGAGIDGWWDFPRPEGAAGSASALVDCLARPPAILREGPERWPAELAGLDWDSPEQ